MSLQINAKQLKYHRVESELRKRIRSLTAGDRLPSERDLAALFACNVLTVRRGLANLMENGMIVRRPGSGTFVADSAASSPDTPSATTQGASRIGLLICIDTDAYGNQVLSAVAGQAGKRAVDLQSAWVHSYGKDALDAAASLATAGCVALILPWFPPHMGGEVSRFVRACPLPVALPQLIPGLEANCFERPEVFGGGSLRSTKALCHYFASLGHQRIAYLGPDNPANPIMQQQLSSYSCAVSSLGGQVLCGQVGADSSTMDALAERWQAYRGHLAIICHDDTYAGRFITAMHKLGLSAPDDFAIIGHNNSETSRFTDPPLTTLCQDFAYIGEWLLRSALGMARGVPDRSSALPRHRLLVRRSCGGHRALTDAILAQMNALGIDPVEAADDAGPAAPFAPAVAAPGLSATT